MNPGEAIFEKLVSGLYLGEVLLYDIYAGRLLLDVATHA